MNLLQSNKGLSVKPTDKMEWHCSELCFLGMRFQKNLMLTFINL